MPTVRKRYIVTGQIQDVGYRTLVKQKARKKGLVGVARNLADGTVEIVCEGEPSAIDIFLKDIDQKTDNPSPLDIDVSNIVESPPAPGGEYKSFEVDYGKKLSFAERSTKDREEITVLGASIMNQKLDGVGQKVDGVGKDVQVVGQKVDSMHTDMNKRFDHMAGRYDMIAASLKDAIVHMDRNAEKTDKAIEKSRKETILAVRRSQKETAELLAKSRKETAEESIKTRKEIEKSHRETTLELNRSRKEVAASNRELANAVKFMIKKLSDRPIPRKTSGKKKR
jgi:acylphosphatase